MLLSIIVPVYNVENYLIECIESLLNQELENYEIILINDGSTDNSPTICNYYKEKYKIIKVFNQTNKGLSAARNRGIKLAKGKYISFVDSDDFVLKNTYKEIVRIMEMEKLDILSVNAFKYISKNKTKLKTKKRSFESKKLSGIEFLKKSYLENAMSHCVPFNVYKREMILENKILFKKGILHEDNLWTPQVFIKAKNVMYYDIDFYMHRKREGSITQKKDKKKNSTDLLKTCYELDNIYIKINDKQTKFVLDNVLVTTYLWAIATGKLVPENNNLVKLSFLKNKSLNSKNKVKVFIFKKNPELYIKLFNFINSLRKLKENIILYK